MAKNKETNNIAEAVDVIEDAVEEMKLPIGLITDCFRLNVRKNPDKNAEVVFVVESLTSLKIDENKSTKDWYYVIGDNGKSGYCMKQYVTIKS